MSLRSQDLPSTQRPAKTFLALPTTERLFQLILAVYFLVCAHYTFPNFGGYGLTLPANYVAWMMMSILIGLGLWQWARANPHGDPPTDLVLAGRPGVNPAFARTQY
ncbi:MAG: hypothetical protein P8I59_01525 [Pseudomonadales bacterium]|nr:hypothetical protein [Pseudomonadales bacterium]